MAATARRPDLKSPAESRAHSVGLDQRDILPPFLPRLRNEDGLFGRTLSLCSSGLYTGLIPYSFLHEPPEFRSATWEDLWKSIETVRVTDVILLILDLLSFKKIGKSTEPNLRRLGSQLEEFASIDPELFSSIVRNAIARTAEIQALQLRIQYLSGTELPDFLLQKLETYRVKLMESLETGKRFTPGRVLANGL